MTNLRVMVLLLALAPSIAFADDARVLDDGVDLERAHRIENGVAAGLTASLLTYESVVLIKGAMDVEPSGGFVDFSAIGKGVGYTLGTFAGLGAAGMLGLAIHDGISSPVADARDTYRSGDHIGATSQLADRELSTRAKAIRAVMWMNFGLDTALFTYGAITYSSDPDLGKVHMWIGGTLAAVSGTLLLHTREPVAKRTYRRFTFGVTPTGVAAAGVF